MKNNTNLIYSFSLVIGDFITLVGAFSVAYIIRVKYDPRHLIEQIPATTFLYTLLIILPLWVLVHASIGLYNRSVYENRFSEFGRLILGSFLGILVVIGYDFVADGTIFPARLVAVYGLLLGFGFLVIFRTLARTIRRQLFSYGIGVDNTLVIGDGKSSKQLLEELSNVSLSGYEIIGLVGFTSDKVSAPTYVDFASAIKALKKKSIHSIVQTKLFASDEKNAEILSYAQAHHIAYRFVPGNQDVFSGNISVGLFNGVPVVNVHQTALIGWGRIVKRLFDLVFGLICFIVAIPFIAIGAILIKVANPKEKVFFSQIRLTQFDRPFKTYKLRSQKQAYDNTTPEEAFASMGKPELAKQYRAGGDSLAKDPRLIRLGNFIRATSIDELPQLINVIRGDISLVGPRALIPQELESVKQRHNILSVKSGMTGLAQVSGRRDITFDERRKLDVYYVQNWSFWLDISILLRTIRVVIGGIGAK